MIIPEKCNLPLAKKATLFPAIRTRGDNSGDRLCKIKPVTGKLAVETIAKARQDLQKTLKSSIVRTEKHSLLILETNWINHWSLMRTIARLGVTIVDTHKRITNCEKDIKDLKLRFK